MPRLARRDARPPHSAWLEGGPDPRDGGLARQTYGGQAPGVLHHIMVRGMERRSMFKDNKARHNVFKRERGVHLISQPAIMRLRN